MVTNYNKKKKMILITTVFLLVILSGLIVNKINTLKYNGKINVVNLEVNNKTLSNSNTKSISETKNNNTKISGNQEIEYDINYMLEAPNDEKIGGRTAIIEVILNDNDVNYATFELINEENITSKIIDNGKTMEITAKNITTNKRYELTIKLNLVNAPNDYKISPLVNVKEKTSAKEKMYAKTLEVETNSVTGTVTNSSSSSEISIEPVTICKVDEVGCIDSKTTYTNENGSYSFSDLEIGEYEIKSPDDDSSSTNVNINNGNNVANINVNSNNTFKATINKYVKKVEILESGNLKTLEYNKLNKVALSVKNMSNASLRVIYEFEITNNSSKPGYVKVVKEDLPEGMEIDKSYEKNKDWIEKDGYFYNKTLSNTELQVNQTRTLEIALKTKSTHLAKNYLNNVSINGEVYHTVNFIYNDEVIYQEIVLDTDLVPNHAVPEKEGVNISGWYTEKEGKGQKFNFNTPIQNDINLYAVDQMDSVDITFINRLKPYTYTEKVIYGEKVDEPKKDNTVDGYTFKCWQKMDSENDNDVYNEEDFDETKCFDFNTINKEPISLIATYTINKYKIRFLNKNSQGIYEDYHTENITSPFETNYGTLLTEPVPEPHDVLLDFIGWFESDDDGNSFKDHSYNFSNKVDRDITLYSVFDKAYKYYNVTFVVQDTSSVVKVKANSLVEQPEDPKIKGYEFDGWYETDTYDGDEFDFNTPITKNMILYAKLEESGNNVTFKVPYDIPKTDNEEDEENFEIQKVIEVEYGDTVDKPLDPIKECKEFIGWFEKDETGKFKSEPFSFDTEITKETTLYALYKVKDVNVRFEYENGELIGEEQIIACGDKPVVPTPKPIPGKELTCFEEKSIEECTTPDVVVTHDTTYVAKYDDIAKVIIEHEPTEWTNQNVLVTITMPEAKIITDKKTIIKTLEDGTVINTVTYEEHEVSFDNQDDYDIEYKIDDGEYQKYNDKFEVEKNSTVEARLKKKATKEIGNNVSHIIDNIDKIAPRIDELSASDISYDKFSVNLTTTDLNDIEKVSGIKNIKFYILGEETPFYDQDFSGNESEQVKATKKGLMELTEYTVRTVITDVAGNVTEDSDLKVTTTPGEHDIVAQIISLNGVDLEEENYITYYSLNSAISGVVGSDGSISKAGCTTLGPKCTIQMLKSVNESATIPFDLDVTLDLNGKTISNAVGENNLERYNLPVTSATLINESKLTIVDNNDSEIGLIQNVEEKGVGIYNVNSQNSILTLGNDEAEDESSASVVNTDKPVISGTINGIYNSSLSTFNFYDGKVKSTSSDVTAAPVYGAVTKTPFKYNASIIDTSSDPNVDPNTKIESLYILADAVARVDSTYYTYLNGDHPLTALKAAEKKYSVTTENILSNNQSLGLYGFDYDTENETLTSNNINTPSSLAESVVSIDLNSIPDLPDAALYQVKINAKISSEENNDVGCIVMNESIDPINSCSNSGITLSGNVDSTDYIYPNNMYKKKNYYLHFVYSKNDSIDSYEDKFQINKIQIIPANVKHENAIISNGEEYSFALTSNNELVNENTGVNSSMSYGYIPIDTTNYSDTKLLTISGNISSEQECDIGYITLSESTTKPNFESDELLLETSGTKDFNINKDILPGKIYYLHIAYVKDKTDSSGLDKFTIKKVDINNKIISDFDFANPNLVTSGSYGFEFDGNKIKSNNKGISSSRAQSYIEFDLTGETSNKDIVINAEISSERYDRGYIVINDTPDDFTSNPSNSLINISGDVSARDYSGTLEAGKMNYVHFIYSKNSSDYSGTDSFIINDISTTAKVSLLELEKSCLTKEVPYPGDMAYTNYNKKTSLNGEEIKTIHLLKNITIDTSLFIESENEIILDLNGYSLNINTNDSVITNSGNLTIVDEQYEETGNMGTISNLGYRTISNTGTLNIIEGNISSSNPRANDNYGSTIVNTGILKYQENSNIVSTDGNTIYNNSSGQIKEMYGNLSQEGENYFAIVDNSRLQDEYNNLNIKNATNGIHFINLIKNNKMIKNSNIENITDTAIINSGANIEIDSTTRISSNLDGILSDSDRSVTTIFGNITANQETINNARGTINIKSGDLISQNGTTLSNVGTINVENENEDSTINITGNIAFSNSGIINMKSGVLNSENENINAKESIFNMEGGNVNSNKTAINNEGTINASKGIIDYGLTTSRSKGIFNKLEATANIFGTLNIHSNTEESTGITNIGILNMYGQSQISGDKTKIGVENFARDDVIFNLGISDEIVDVNYPKIYSYNTAVVNSGNSRFNYYDGIITGAVDEEINGFISDSPKSYDLNISINNSNNSLEDITLKIPDNGIVVIVSKEGVEKDSYSNIQSAINAFDNNADEIIKVTKSIRTILPNMVLANKKIKFDLNGNIIKMYKKESLFTNLGDFTITDNTSLTNEDVYVRGSGNITSYATAPINNQSSLILNGIDLYEYNEGIINRGNLDISNVYAYSRNANLISNNGGNLTINSGYLESDGPVINNQVKGTIVMNGGTLAGADITIYSNSSDNIEINAGSIRNNNLSGKGLFVSNSKVTINGGSFIGAPYPSKTDVAIEGYSDSNITINNSDIQNFYKAIVLSSNSEMLINDINVTDSIIGLDKSVSSNLIINDGTFVTNDITLFNNSNDDTAMIINGGSFTSINEYVVRNKKGPITINNSTLQSLNNYVIRNGNYRDDRTNDTGGDIEINKTTINASKGIYNDSNNIYTVQLNEATINYSEYGIVNGNGFISFDNSNISKLDNARQNNAVINGSIFISNNSTINGDIRNCIVKGEDIFEYRTSNTAIPDNEANKTGIVTHIVTGTINGNIDNGGKLVLGLKDSNMVMGNPVINGKLVVHTGNSVDFYDGIFQVNEEATDIFDSQTFISDIETGYQVQKDISDVYSSAHLAILPVAEITMSNNQPVTENNLFYNDLSEAFESPLCDSICTIKMLASEDISVEDKESPYITINDSQEITLDMNSKQIKHTSGKIENNGIFKITNSSSDVKPTITELEENEFLINNGTLSIENIRMLDTYIINNSTLNLTKFSLTNTKENEKYLLTNNINGIINASIGSNRIEGTILNSGIFNLNNGTIESIINGNDNVIGNLNIKSGTANKILNNPLSEIKIGEKDSEVSTTNPTVKDITNDRLGKVYFYDGLITGDIIGAITEIEDGYSITNNNNTKTLTKENALEVDGTDYMTLKEALNDSSCNSNNECTIKLLRDLYITQQESTFDINNLKKITIDLNGNKLYSGIKTLFRNYGELIIKDTMTDGEILSYDGVLIYNEGKFTLKNGMLSEKRDDVAILNMGDGTVLIEDGIVTAGIASIVNIPKSNLNSASTTIKGGTINSTKSSLLNPLNNKNVTTNGRTYTSEVNLKSLNVLSNQVDSLIYNNISENIIKQMFENSATIINLTNKIDFIGGDIKTVGRSNTSSIYSSNGLLNLHGGNIDFVLTEIDDSHAIAVNTDSTNIDFTSGKVKISVENQITKGEVKFSLTGIQTLNSTTNISGGNIKIDKGVIERDRTVNQKNYTSNVTGIKSVGELNISNIDLDINNGEGKYFYRYTEDAIEIEQHLSNLNITGIQDRPGEDYSKSIVLKNGASLDVSTSSSNLVNKIVGETPNSIKVHDGATTARIETNSGTLEINDSKTGDIYSTVTSTINNSNVGDTYVAGDFNSDSSSFVKLSVNNNSETNLTNVQVSGEANFQGNGITNLNGSTITDKTYLSNGRVVNITSSDLGDVDSSSYGKMTLNSGSIKNITMLGNFEALTGTIGNITVNGSYPVTIKKEITSVGNIANNSSATIDVEGGQTGGILNSAAGIINIFKDVTVNSSGIGIENAGEGTVNIGSDDDDLSITNPNIIGATYGVFGKTGTINFYDGIITGMNGVSILGSISYNTEKYRINRTRNEDSSESAILVEKGEVDSPIYANNQSFYDLQTAINSSPETSENSPIIITITKDIELTSDVVVSAGKYFSLYKCGHEINYNGFTISGDGTMNIYDGEPGATASLDDNSLGATIRELLNIDSPIKVRKNIILYSTDEGKGLDLGDTYELKFLTKDGEYEKIDVTEDTNNVGRYTVSTTNSDDIIRPINGRIYINNIPDGNYKVISSSNSETTFTVEENGTLSGNAKINNTTNLTDAMSTSSAEVIVGIQTGLKVFKFGILSTLVTIIIGLLIMVSRRARNE